MARLWLKRRWGRLSGNHPQLGLPVLATVTVRPCACRTGRAEALRSTAIQAIQGNTSRCASTPVAELENGVVLLMHVICMK